jgi:hypothetical protein
MARLTGERKDGYVLSGLTFNKYGDRSFTQAPSCPAGGARSATSSSPSARTGSSIRMPPMRPCEKAVSTGSEQTTTKTSLRPSIAHITRARPKTATAQR